MVLDSLLWKELAKAKWLGWVKSSSRGGLEQHRKKRVVSSTEERQGEKQVRLFLRPRKEREGHPACLRVSFPPRPKKALLEKDDLPEAVAVSSSISALAEGREAPVFDGIEEEK